VATAAGGHDQQLVLYYAASMFTSVLAGLLATARRARGNADTNRSYKPDQSDRRVHPRRESRPRKPRGTANARGPNTTTDQAP
jgi:hypothetical protein